MKGVSSATITIQASDVSLDIATKGKARMTASMSDIGDRVITAGFILLLVVSVLWLVGILSAYVLTNHAKEARVETGEVRADIWYRVENCLQGGCDKSTRVLAASCMNAYVRMRDSPRHGLANPHLKVAVCKPGFGCDYVIIGMAGEPAIVTARASVPESAFIADMIKDSCVWMDATSVLPMIGTLLP